MAPVWGSDYSPLNQALGELHQHNQDLEEFIDQLLQEISKLGQLVETGAAELQQARQEMDRSAQSAGELAEENSRLAIQVQQRSEALNQAHTEIERLREQLKMVEAAAPSQAEFEEQQQRVQTLEKQLSQAREVTNQAAERDEEIQQLRSELAAAKLEILKRDQAEVGNGSSAELNALYEKNQALEGELHQARGHALELTERIDQQQRELHQQKSAWTVELQAMRRLLERPETNSQQRGGGASFADTSVLSETATVPRDELEIRANSNNTVVDSVMAQFAKLQRDVNKRRSQRR